MKSRATMLILFFVAGVLASEEHSFTREEIESGAFLDGLKAASSTSNDRIEIQPIEEGRILLVLLPSSHGGTAGRPVAVMFRSRETKKYTAALWTCAPIHVAETEGYMQINGYSHGSCNSGNIDGLMLSRDSDVLSVGHLPVVVSSSDPALGNDLLAAIQMHARFTYFSQQSTEPSATEPTR